MAAESNRKRDGWRGIRRRYHFHTPLVLYVGVSLLLAIGALNSQNNLLFWAMGLAFGGLIVSGFLSGSSLMGLRLERRIPKATSVGESMRVRYVLTSVSRVLPACALHIEEVESGDGSGPRPTWPTHLSAPRGYVAVLGPRERLTVETRVEPTCRGQATFGAIRVWSTFPFGLIRKSVTFVEPASVVVRPASFPLKRGVVESATRTSTSIRYSGALNGNGEEFHSLRPYRAGDPPRMIAWRPTARSGELVTRVLASPPPVRLWVVLEADAGRDGHESVERAITLTASILLTGQRRGYAVGLLIPSAGVRVLPQSSERHMERLLDQLAVVRPGSAPTRLRGPARPGGGSVAGGCVVVHAGEIDRRSGPPWARHVRQSELESLRAPGAGEGPGRDMLTVHDLVPAPGAVPGGEGTGSVEGAPSGARA